MSLSIKTKQSISRLIETKGDDRTMYVWNIADPDVRKQTFEPRAAEMFTVQGKTTSRDYTALVADPKLYDGLNVCDYCAFGTKVVPNAAPLCSYVHVACKPDERQDKRQIIFKLW